MRGVDLDGADIDAPWLADGSLLVNGVDVAADVEAELCPRFPGRDQRRARGPEGLRRAWSTLEDSWAAVLDRVTTMPAGTPDVSVAGEWSLRVAVPLRARRPRPDPHRPRHPARPGAGVEPERLGPCPGQTAPPPATSSRCCP